MSEVRAAQSKGAEKSRGSLGGGEDGHTNAVEEEEFDSFATLYSDAVAASGGDSRADGGLILSPGKRRRQRRRHRRRDRRELKLTPATISPSPVVRAEWVEWTSKCGPLE